MGNKIGNDLERQPGPMSRRDFCKLLFMLGLLAGCGPAREVISPTDRPVSTPTSPPPPTPPPTATATAIPLTAPATVPPTTTPTPRPAIPTPEAVRFYPDGPSRVVRTRHSGVWQGDALDPQAVGQMLDASATALCGMDDSKQAWAAMFDPRERIGIKVNTFPLSYYWTPVPLVMAVVDRLLAIGVPAENIVILDRSSKEIEDAGFTINKTGVGVRCCGTDSQYAAGWKVLGRTIGISKLLLGCDVIINMPLLKQHNHSGITLAMKNYFGSIDRPDAFHRPRTGQALVELNALAPIRQRSRLVIGSALQICPISRNGWYEAVNGDAILMSFDPVAHDTIGFEMLSEVMSAAGYDAKSARELAAPWLQSSADLGLGTNLLEHIDLVEVKLG